MMDLRYGVMIDPDSSFPAVCQVSESSLSSLRLCRDTNKGVECVLYLDML